jgi:hypothetical protein
MTTTAVREHPLILTGPQVRALLNTRPGTWPAEPIDPARPFKWQHRVPVQWTNSTVLGYPAKRYWPHLLFEHAVARDQASIMVAMVGPDRAPRDVHLSVPYNEEGCRDQVDDLPRYRVRPVWEEGELCWVKETWMVGHHAGEGSYSVLRPTGRTDRDGKVFYKATGTWDESDGRYPWRSSILMPRWAARLAGAIQTIRVQRLQDISEADALAEGCDGCCPIGSALAHAAGPCSDHHAQVWEASYGRKPGYRWRDNPWVWVRELSRVEILMP